MLNIMLRHQLHNQTQISADYVLAQLFATLMNAIRVKWLNETEDMDWSANKQLVKRWEKNMSTNWSSEIFINVKKQFLWNKVFSQELQDPNFILLMVQIR